MASAFGAVWWARRSPAAPSMTNSNVRSRRRGRASPGRVASAVSRRGRLRS